MNSFYITTPIYYVNANPHLGHAYSTIVADAAARFHKMLNDQAIFLTGTDEHGDKIVQTAEKNNISPREFTDQISANFQNLWPRLNCFPDYFKRTTDESHVRAVQAFLQKIYDAGDIYFGEFGGYYCYGCERFYTEKELDNGLCPQHLTKPQFINEKNYFFKMSAYLPWLHDFIEKNPEVIQPDRYRREALAMLEAGALEDLCISRPKSRLDWGIELPFDHDYVCYVWFDALTTYISGIGWPENKQEFHKWWPGNHLIAKDILKPHAIFWPCMLKSAGMANYRHLYVHGYWLVRDTKMSKSLGNVIDPLDMAKRFGLDSFRYFLLREMRFGSDANFGEDILVTRINADLANDLGNLFSRVLSMNSKYFANQSPPCGPYEPCDHEIAALAGKALANYVQLLEKMEFSLGLEALWELASALNKYVDSQAPWTLSKNNQQDRLGTVINVLLSGLRKLAICLWPIMPATSKTMLEQLGEDDLAKRADKGKAPIDILTEINSFGHFPANRKIAASSNLFPRIEVKKKEPAPEPEHKTAKKQLASIDTFNSLDIRVGEILTAEKHPDADRILKLEIDFGESAPRQILSGLAQYYSPADLIGKKVCAIINLAPRKIRGLVSNGMVLTAEDDQGLHLLDPGKNTAIGGKIG